MTAGLIGAAFLLMAVSPSVRRSWRASGSHRAPSRRAVRDENKVLRARQAAAEELCARLVKDRDALYVAWQAEARRACEAELVVACQQRELQEHRALAQRLRAELRNTNAAPLPVPRRETGPDEQLTEPRGIAVRPLHEALGITPTT